MNRRCLGCNHLIARGSYCSTCKQGNGRSAWRNRQTQATFRARIMEKDDGQCTWTDPDTGERCDVTNPAALDAHHVDDTGRLLCNSLGNGHHAAVDKHAR